MEKPRASEASLVFIVHSDGSQISLRQTIFEVWSGDRPAGEFSVRLERSLPQNHLNLTAQETVVSNGNPRSLVLQAADRSEV